jgi:lipopolysaccharide export system protein LptA
VGATAEGHVTLRQGAAEVVANQATFDAAADTVVFTGDPRWRLDDRSGSADRLSIALQSRIERAEGRVMMQAPAGLLGGRTWLMPGGGVTKPETAKTGASSTNVVQIRSDDFEYAPAATEGAPDIAMFRGHVEVRDGGGARLTCDRIRVQLDSKQRAARELEASGGVEMRFEDEGGDRLARGDRLRYDAARDEVELSGASGVTFVFRDKRGESRGFGQRAVYRVKPDTLTLLGNPMVEAPEGRFTGDQVRLDRRTGDVNAAGYWRARLPLPGTNQFTLPEGFKPKSKR